MNKLTRIFLIVLLLAGIGLAIAFRGRFDVATFEQWIREAGPSAPLVFMLAYALGTVFFLPGSALTLAGGVMFGPMLGTFYNLTGATAGAVLSFLVARYIASDWVERRTEGRLRQIKEGIESEGWRFVAFVRLVPLFPFNLLNYALGLTRIKLSSYAITSYICMLPGAVAYTYLGYAGREALAGREGIVRKGLLALGLLVMIIFIPYFIRRLRASHQMISVQELKQRLNHSEELVILDVRSAAEFSGELGHIPGAINIAIEDLQKRLPELEPHRKRQIAVVCRTDKRSARAAKILSKAGFGSVTVVRGGMEAWRHNLDGPGSF